jgi:hypothetical protein
VLGTQRVNRTVLPRLRAQGSGHLVWISSNSVHGGTPPFVGPYVAAEYDDLYGEFRRQMAERMGALIPDDATSDAVADAVVTAVNAPPGRRPYRVHVDPSRNGGEIVSTVADRIRAEFLYRAGLEDLLTPTSSP